MLFLVRMDVNIPRDLPEAQANEIKAREKAYSQDLQRDGRLPATQRQYPFLRAAAKRGRILKLAGQ